MSNVPVDSHCFNRRKNVNDIDIRAFLLSLLAVLSCTILGCFKPADPPVVFYVKDIKWGLLEQATEAMSTGYHRSFKEHLERRNQYISLADVPEEELVLVCVDTGFTYQQTLDLLRSSDGGLVVVRQGGEKYAADTPLRQIQFEKSNVGYVVTFILDKQMGTQIGATEFFLHLKP